MANLVETRRLVMGSIVESMRDSLRRPVLNPAFKRCQHLPLLAAGTPGKHACAAPVRTEARRNPQELDSLRQNAPVREPLASLETRPSSCQYQSPI